MCFIHIIFAFITTFAGSFVEENNNIYYKTDSGEYAKDTWVWIDSDNDNIAECYRFSSDGTVAINYTHYDGKKTNDKGQYIIDGKAVKKLVSSGKLVEDKKEVFGPYVEKSNDKYILKNVLVPDSMSVKGKRKIEAGLFWGQDSIGDIDLTDGEIINNVKKKYDPFSDIEAERGVIYSPDAKDNGIIVNNSGEKFVPGIDAKKYISASHKFNKDVEEAIIYNGDKWTHCMELQGHKSSVKFLLNKYNYMYFEFSNENHKNNDSDSDAVLEVYVDNKLEEEISDFTNGDPWIEELDFTNNKSVEIRLVIKEGNLSERVYLRNVKFRKIDDDE